MRKFETSDDGLADLAASAGLVETTDDPTVPPSVDTVALALIQGMLASGKFGDDANAVIMSAWWAVPTYYEGRHTYPTQIAPLYFAGAPPEATEDGMSPEFNPEALNQ